MADRGKTIDPFDVEALEKSLNDSAIRVSKIWTSFLVFGLYLVVSAGTVTHRQLLLQESIKLPILNIELFLVSFFVIAPLIFVTLHIYVLVQILLLARTSQAYEQALVSRVSTASAQERFRHRLPNTLFAQIFAGASTERAGIVGMVLKLMAWSTLVIAPAMVLLTVQIKFLPYHSLDVTWFHRALLAIDLGATLILWSAALDLNEDVSWRRLSRNWFVDILVASTFYFSFVLASFPGEIQANWVTRVQRVAARVLPDRVAVDTRSPGECEASSFMTAIFPQSFDRLVIENLHTTDDQTIASIDRDAKLRDQNPYEGQRTRVFRDRDLRCASLRGVEFRRADFTHANLAGADLTHADLQGAQFLGANLSGAVLDRARLQSTSLERATLIGATLVGSSLQGANVAGADLRGASLSRARAQGANFLDASIDSADLTFALMQGSNLTKASIRAANMQATALQGAWLEGSDLSVSNLSNALLWRATAGTCSDAHVAGPIFDAVLASKNRPDSSNSGTAKIPDATPDVIAQFIAESIADVPEIAKGATTERLNNALTQDRETELGLQLKLWQACANDTASRTSTHPERVAVNLVRLVCLPTPQPRSAVELRYLVDGIFRNWIDLTFPGTPVSQSFARLLLDWISKDYCMSFEVLGRNTRERLRVIRDGRQTLDDLNAPVSPLRVPPWVDQIFEGFGFGSEKKRQSK